MMGHVITGELCVETEGTSKIFIQSINQSIQKICNAHSVVHRARIWGADSDSDCLLETGLNDQRGITDCL